VIVRVEDHDRIRCRPEYETAMLEDMAWLGFITTDVPFVRQSDRNVVYERALSRLRDAGHVYVCDCSRADIRRRQQQGGAGEDERYDGYCRTRARSEGAGRGLRVALGSGTETFNDLLLGAVTDQADRFGDLLLRDRDGHWTYHLAVVADDREQGIDLIVRGDDLQPSTAPQIRLAKLLGRVDAPTYLHHPLVLKPAGEKLSKASGDTGIREMRARGESAEAVIARAATAVGFTASSIAERIRR
jgi:glutamyl-tRNA synthetase/glutamyl-Q tRNA(Asp) synthetase